MQQVFKAGMLMLIFMGISSCYYDNLDELNAGRVQPCVIPAAVSYANDIKPIMNATCGTSNGACHVIPGPLNIFIGLNTYDDVKDAIDNNLMNAINHNGSAIPMPKGGGKLDDCSINKIQTWINQGALNN